MILLLWHGHLARASQPWHGRLARDSAQGISPSMHSLPDLIAAIIITAYWARALRLAYKMRQQTGNAANWTPPEDLGRKIRILWRPLVGIWIAHLFINAFTGPEHLP